MPPEAPHLVVVMYSQVANTAAGRQGAEQNTESGGGEAGRHMVPWLVGYNLRPRV